jgi:hypothetical protein
MMIAAEAKMAAATSPAREKPRIGDCSFVGDVFDISPEPI